MGISVANLLLILVIILVIFGAGKLPKVMGDLGKGIKNLRDGLRDDNNHIDNPNNKDGSEKILR